MKKLFLAFIIVSMPFCTTSHGLMSLQKPAFIQHNVSSSYAIPTTPSALFAWTKNNAVARWAKNHPTATLLLGGAGLLTLYKFFYKNAITPNKRVFHTGINNSKPIFSPLYITNSGSWLTQEEIDAAEMGFIDDQKNKIRTQAHTVSQNFMNS